MKSILLTCSCLLLLGAVCLADDRVTAEDLIKVLKQIQEEAQ